MTLARVSASSASTRSTLSLVRLGSRPLSSVIFVSRWRSVLTCTWSRRGGLGVAAIELEEDTQRRLQVTAAAAIVLAQSAQDAVGEPGQRVVVEHAEKQPMVVEV